MTRVGITGHQRLPDEATWSWVMEAMGEILAGLAAPLVGVSSLAVGADQRFAGQILELGGRLEVVLPFGGYRERLAEGDERTTYGRLLERAALISVLPRAGRSDEEAYLHAGQEVVARCSVLLAVWDEAPAAGPGGTADVVAHARKLGRALVVVNPSTRMVTRATS